MASNELPDSVRDRVLSAAVTLFAAQGFDRTSVQEVCTAAGVTKGALYHYFSSKDELLWESYRRLLNLQVRSLAEIKAEQGPAEPRLRRAAEDLVRTTIDNLGEAQVLERNLHLVSSPTRQQVLHHLREYRDAFGGVIDDGVRSGEFRTDLDPRLVMTNFFGAITYLTTWYRPAGRWSIDDIAEGTAEQLLAALRP